MLTHDKGMTQLLARTAVLVMTAVVFTGLPAAYAATPEFKSQSENTLFIELYVSEATKGSPPAEAWLASIAADNSGLELWKDFVPVVFPVDYGDKPGRWKDRYAKKEFTGRLLSYASKWGLTRPYVP